MVWARVRGRDRLEVELGLEAKKVQGSENRLEVR